MLNRYYIIDDFYADPEDLVSTAMESIDTEGSRGNYPGVMTSRVFLADTHHQLFSKLLNEPSINSSTELNGKVRFSRTGDAYAQNIHFDPFTRTKWAGVIYLSKEHPKVDGTSFWKHIETGLESMPRTVEELAKYGWKSKEDVTRFLEEDGMDYSKWEKTTTIPYKYNRLVLFRPWMFHSPGESFGNTLQTSRIVQTLFLGN